MKFYISDLHFGHKNVLTFDNRPFESIEQMNEVLVNNWNSVVKANDDIYVLGDMFWNNNIIEEILPKLKGNKYLILGNHDRINKTMKDNFIWIKEMETIKDGDNHIVLCHYPIAHWKNQHYGYLHLYGHIHTGRDTRPFETYGDLCKKEEIPFECYNVGCMIDYMDYTPRTLDYIRENGSK